MTSSYHNREANNIESDIRISSAISAIFQLADRSENGDMFDLNSWIRIARRHLYTPGLRNVALTSISSQTAPFLLPRAGGKSPRIYRSESERDVRSIHRTLDSIMSFGVRLVQNGICCAGNERAGAHE